MPDNTHPAPPIDLLVIGGGINGCGIARDAVGRGLSVMLCEMGDLGQATSSASTKLFHGGLRYLEYFQFRLVREALAEREVLLRNMPHISWPMRFVLPLHPDMRFDSEPPASRLLAWVAPWAKGRRPAWLIRLGLFLYDHLGQRQTLPATRRLALHNSPEGAPLQPQFSQAFEYSDCWVQDSRLVSLNARDAAERGARICTRTRVVAAQRGDTHWDVTLQDTKTGTQHVVQARMLVNAAGPWAAQVLGQVLQQNSPDRLRLVRGSHIVTRRLFAHEKAYFFQGSDGRIIFAIPYEQDFTLIGTDVPKLDTHAKTTGIIEDLNLSQTLIELQHQDEPSNISIDQPVMQDLHERFERLQSLSRMYYEICGDLVDGYLSISSHKLNNTMRVLTLITAIFVPLSFLAGIYGMNFEVIPELHHPDGYFILLGVMACIALGLIGLFKWKRWF